MYDENSFKNYIFWLKVKRVFLIILFSIIGACIGILISQFFIDLLLVLNQNFKAIIITISTLLFFGISLLLTAGTGKEVQEGYWKMAVLRKLTVISKKLDYLENLDHASPEQKSTVKKVVKEIKQEIEKKPEENIKNEPEIEQLTFDDNQNNEVEKNSDNSLEEENTEIKMDFAGNIVNPPEKKKSPSKQKISKLAKK